MTTTPSPHAAPETPGAHLTANASTTDGGAQDGVPGGTRVLTTADALYIEHLVCSDPDVLAAIDGHDPVRSVLDLLRYGAIVSASASARLDSALLDTKMAELQNQFQRTLDANLSSLTETTSGLLDSETGSVPVTMKQIRDEMSKKLSDTFDPDLATSAMSLIEKELETHQQRIKADVRTLLDPNVEHSPLHGLERRLRESGEKQAKDFQGLVTDLRERLAAAETTKSMAEKTTGKGFTYEDAVEAALDRMVVPYGDSVTNVGTMAGSNGTKKGDLVVDLAEEDTTGEPLRLVLECKKTGLSKPAAKKELQQSIDNRDAAAGILVFASAEDCPAKVPFSYSGNQALVVYDDEHPDTQVLQLAYAWARWVARRSQRSTGLTDPEAVIDAIRAAEAGLRQKSEVLKGLTHASKGIDTARAAVEAMTASVDEQLKAVRIALG